MAFEGLSDKLSAVFKKLKGKGKLSESDIKESMREVRMALLEADVNIAIVKEFVKRVTERSVGVEVLESLTPAQQVIKIVNEELIAIMGTEAARVEFASKPPTIIMLVGLQGSGKTTHAGKLANYFRKQSHRPLLVACDVYRPAAIKQLQVVGAQLNIPVFEMGDKEKPENIATKAIAHAKDYGHDIVILDTAGRLHIDEALMDELKRVKERVNPKEILLVVDAMTGQDAVNVAQSFNEQLEIDGVILTKLDGDTRGGAALSVRYVTGKPIKFAGVGEKLSDLEQFHPDRMASRILGMGDVLTLIEKAEQEFDAKAAEKLEQKMRTNSFNFNDFLEQLANVKKMGPLDKLLEMIPGIDKNALKDVKFDPKEMARVEGIIHSMTDAERENPDIINPSRKRRIAAGSGMKVEDVNRLLKRFEESKKMMKKLGGFGKSSSHHHKKKKKHR